jgi:hypothetical protein
MPRFARKSCPRANAIILVLPGCQGVWTIQSLGKHTAGQDNRMHLAIRLGERRSPVAVALT